MSLFLHKVYFDKSFYQTLDLAKATFIVRNENPKKYTAITALSNPKKMNCFAWNISADKCITGSRLRLLKGTVCSKCYAHAGHYLIGRTVKSALEERYQAWKTQEHWMEAMAYLIVTLSKEKFRWFDAGDLQDEYMLLQICEIAKVTRTTKYWLPTHEDELVTNFVKRGYELPENITIRLSGDYIDGEVPTSLAAELNAYPNVKGFIGTSGVMEKENWANRIRSRLSKSHDESTSRA